MVIAVLANRFAPSSRGLKRAEKRRPNPNQQHNNFVHGQDWRLHRLGEGRCFEKNNDNDTIQDACYHNNLPNGDENVDNIGDHGDKQKDGIMKIPEHPYWKRRLFSSTGHRRKPFRAMACLTSLASDLDLIADWVFYRETLKNDNEYRAEYAANGGADVTTTSGYTDAADATDTTQPLPYLIPPILLRLVLASCILGTIMWVILATDGRIAAPILRRLGIDKLSIGFILFLCVCVEDIPQVVLTFLIEDYYEEEYLSAFAVCNVLASLYDTLIKIAEAIDERNDMVETGAWCKHSIDAAHTESITAIVTLLPPQITSHLTSTATSASRTNALNAPLLEDDAAGTPRATSTGPILLRRQPDKLKSNQRAVSTSSTSAATLSWPCLRFISSSTDGSIKLWDSRISSPPPPPDDSAAASASTKRRRSSLWDIAIAAAMATTNNTSSRTSPFNDSTASSDLPAAAEVPEASAESTAAAAADTATTTAAFVGAPEVVQVQTYKGSPSMASGGGVTCLALLGRQPPVDIPHDSDSTIQQKHLPSSSTAHPISNSDSLYFVSGSDNGVARLWHIDSGECIREYRIPTTTPSDSLTRSSITRSTCTSGSGATTSTSTVNSPISSIAVVKAGSIFVTGYQDGVARIWDAWSESDGGGGALLAICRGHHGTIRSMCAMGDGTQFVTASVDQTLRLWRLSNDIVNRNSGDNAAVNMPAAVAAENVADTTLENAMGILLPLESSHSSLQSRESLPDVFNSDTQFGVATSATVVPPATRAAQTSTAIVELNTCHEIYQGHTDAVLCVACMECGTMFASGSMDRTARLWSAETGACLQVFTGHAAGVSAVAAVDEVTLLTGSYDTSVKVWDALRGSCLRTYTGHSAVITGISVMDDDSSFVTSSADRSIKMWVLTALPTDYQAAKVFDQVMDINDGLCRGIDPD